MVASSASATLLPLVFPGVSADRTRAQEISQLKTSRLRALAVELDRGNDQELHGRSQKDGVMQEDIAA